ncbi:hypothetical protein BP6252_01829 [Coleophoma cylindrospora]|uniref:Transcription factor domain-containing protein n=1 Tax=Coleophoma cylindrospora TaxID=1849047 RepID=A0A3D8SD47_9HELO|nr:hypothetical protein BP6252_01829 [Coleophoma cylindrospora]
MDRVTKERVWQFLNITEPKQARSRDFQKCVQGNARRDYRRSELKKQAHEYTETRRRWKDIHKSPSSVTESLSQDDLGIAGVALLPREGSWNRAASQWPEQDPGVSSTKQQATAGAGLIWTEEEIFEKEHARHLQDILHHSQTYLNVVVEPYISCPSGGRQDYYPLVNHFILAFAPSFLPVDKSLDQNPINSLWVSWSLASPVLSSAILACAAVHQDQLCGRKSSVQAVYYTGQTISLLNKALENLDMALSDSTIAAVALLIANE